MPVTTVLSDEGNAMIVESDNDNAATFAAHRFSWSAAFAGAFVATAVSFFLLSLGSGIGLSLISAQTTVTPTFLTLGAIYFLAAQAFGFAAGGHLAGRLIGPAPETAKEEEFRSAAHGLVVWALTVVATATLVAIGSFAATGSAATMAAASGKFDRASGSAMTPSYIGYWVDMLFRPGAGPSQASLAWRQYAQATTGTATDASPAQPNDTNQPSNDQPPTQQMNTVPMEQAPASGSSHALMPSGPAPAQPGSSAVSQGVQPSGVINVGPRDTQIPAAASGSFAPPPSADADKAETANIIEVGMAKGGRLSQYDKDRISALVAQDTGLSMPEATRRVDNAESRIHQEETAAAETARKAASFASLWIALALLFGAVVSVMAAVSARWEDDRVSFGWPRRDPA